MTKSPQLTLDNLPRFLLERGLASAADLVDGYPTIEDRSRRNRNFKVFVPRGQNFLVKQGSLEAGGTAEAVESEAHLLRAAASDAAFDRARWFSPTFVDYDERRRVLTTELIHPSTSLTKYHLNLGEIHFPPEATDTIGRLLASWHAAARRSWRGGTLDFVNRKLPFVPHVREQLRNVPESSGDLRAVYLRLVRDSLDYEAGLEEVEEWQTRWQAIGHGDIRWDNILITHGGGRGGNMNFRLIDWEMAYVGDPAWDLACFLGEYARFWFMTTLGRNVETVADMEEKARFKLSSTHESARALLDSYSRHRESAAGGRKELQRRVARYVPYVLLLVGFESLQRQTRFPGTTRVAVAMAARAQKDPEAACAEWFGL